ncbi:hypothetical protein AM587_10013732 [Phytophthora nicotianae]|uniref:Uncharacterized protein n=1 Tax=Phytophthora nicotianae TaxID=4792 RepID=A0A0W8C1V2_PHYNI|nr:hypothetical protein AM587_10013732 [Phytophthora nicotianae]
MKKSFLQTQAEMARFDSGVPRDREETSDNQISSPMIPHVADKYDPDHPDADWGGYVRRSYKKRFYTNQSGVKDSLTYDEKGGIMPRDEAEKSTISGKKLFEPQQNPSGEQVPGIPFQSAVYQVGPGSSVSTNDWKTMSKAVGRNKILHAPNPPHHRWEVDKDHHRLAKVAAVDHFLVVVLTRVAPYSLVLESSLQPRTSTDYTRALHDMTSIEVPEFYASLSLYRPPERHLPESYTNAASKTLLAEN